MGNFLAVEQKTTLREASYLNSNSRVRARALWILWLDRGVHLAKVSRAARVSRPTVYRYLRIWERFGSVAALDTATARRLQPWKRPGQGSGRASE